MALRADLLPALAAFESAARHQNFTHAAEELHLTASAVSHHVRKLEARLGVALFQRHARGVSLTAEGRQLADAAGSALADVDGVVRALRAGRDEHARVRITTLHSLAYTWLIPRMRALEAAHPDIRLSLDTEVALTRFDDGGPDLGIRHGPGHWPGLTAHLLMDETLFPVASPGFPGLDRIVSAADIARLPLIADHARQGWLDWFRAADVHGVRIEERHTFSDTTDALNAAAFGHGAALARERIAAPYLDAGRLVRLPGPALQARWSYYVVYPAHRRLRPAARRFVDWLLAQPAD
ncbi:LysR family transcriptional regulator [Lysobacter maris]|uniref:LysR family transcriptional regulator n=1 Tax=Marilutibacter maris TaxID=1605891 RepID=A0A508ACH9_9GAMM|nr:LysR substrate-binding domain-containing protein [Lysobacter maris]KAB8176396.1 LysR family transcriptional regulator [Lysobacter maris]